MFRLFLSLYTLWCYSYCFHRWSDWTYWTCVISASSYTKGKCTWPLVHIFSGDKDTEQHNVWCHLLLLYRQLILCISHIWKSTKSNMGQQLPQINRNIAGLREDRSILKWSCFQAFAAEWFLRLLDIYRHCFFQYDLMYMMHYCSFIETWSVYCLFCILILHHLLLWEHRMQGQDNCK